MNYCSTDIQKSYLKFASLSNGIFPLNCQYIEQVIL